jgi:uncharacterized delta-60 repeat protein
MREPYLSRSEPLPRPIVIGVGDGGAKRLCAAILIACLAWLPGQATAATAPLSPIPGFGTGGVAHANGGYWFFPDAVAIDSRGRILVGGEGGPTLATLGHVVFRFLPDGRPDRTFGRSGEVLLPGQARDVALSLDRRGGAYVLASPYHDMVISHLGSDGKPDHRFGTQGTVNLPLDPEMANELVLNHPLLRLPAGGLLVAGRGGTMQERFDESGPLQLRRLSPDGHRVRSFGDDGVATLGDPRLRRLRMFDVGVSADGGILVCGSIRKPRRRYEPGLEFETHREAVVIALTRRGRLDRHFGHDGIATPRVPAESKALLVHAEHDGSILLAGVRARTNAEAPEYGVYRPFLLRLDADGSLVRRFEPTPKARFGSGYEAAKFASNMSNLLATAGRLFIAAGDPEVGSPSLLTFLSQGSGGTYLRISQGAFENIAAIAARGRELVALSTRTQNPTKGAHGFVLRAFQVSPIGGGTGRSEAPRSSDP